jgi:hypothetical protein
MRDARSTIGIGVIRTDLRHGRQGLGSQIGSHHHWKTETFNSLSLPAPFWLPPLSFSCASLSFTFTFTREQAALRSSFDFLSPIANTHTHIHTLTHSRRRSRRGADDGQEGKGTGPRRQEAEGEEQRQWQWQWQWQWQRAEHTAKQLLAVRRKRLGWVIATDVYRVHHPCAHAKLV